MGGGEPCYSSNKRGRFPCVPHPWSWQRSSWTAPSWTYQVLWNAIRACWKGKRRDCAIERGSRYQEGPGEEEEAEGAEGRTRRRRRIVNDLMPLMINLVGWQMTQYQWGWAFRWTDRHKIHHEDRTSYPNTIPAHNFSPYFRPKQAKAGKTYQ